MTTEGKKSKRRVKAPRQTKDGPPRLTEDEIQATEDGKRKAGEGSPSFTEDEIKQALEDGKLIRDNARSRLRRSGPKSNVRFRKTTPA